MGSWSGYASCQYWCQDCDLGYFYLFRICSQVAVKELTQERQGNVDAQLYHVNYPTIWVYLSTVQNGPMELKDSTLELIYDKGIYCITEVLNLSELSYIDKGQVSKHHLV
jgi:hypothetical protein